MKLKWHELQISRYDKLKLYQLCSHRGQDTFTGESTLILLYISESNRLGRVYKALCCYSTLKTIAIQLKYFLITFKTLSSM
jgi:hypothetical protein